MSLSTSLALVLSLIGAGPFINPAHAASLTHGVFDPTFGTSGFTTASSVGVITISSIAIDSQGKIVAGGAAPNAQGFAIMRFTSTGVLDSTFGTSGSVVTQISSPTYLTSIAIDTQGRIVAGGYGYISNKYRFIVARYTSSGVLDTTFGTQGITSSVIGTGGAYLRSIALDSQGRIVAGGVSVNSGDKFTLARYTSGGVLDTTFGTSGITQTGIGASSNISSIALDSQGKIMAAGQAYVEDGFRFTLARYSSDGVLDTSFGTQGITNTNIGTSADIRAVIIDSEGRIVAGGRAEVTSNVNGFALARYTSSGLLDTSFGTGGFTTTVIGNNYDVIKSIATDDLGRIFAGGMIEVSGDPFTIVGYTRNGLLDNSFGTAGIKSTNVSTNDRVEAIAIDTLGRIIAAGFVSNVDGYRVPGIARYLTASPVSAPLASDEAAIAAAAKAAAAAAAAKREAEVKAARADISNKLAKSEKLTLDNFKQAEIAGVTADNFASVQAAILALPAESRSEISQVLKVARKYEVIGKVATGQISTLPITAFVEVGLIPTENKHKTALIAAVRRASTDDRDSYAEIQAVIAAEAASIKARKERLAALISRNNSRKVR